MSGALTTRAREGTNRLLAFFLSSSSSLRFDRSSLEVLIVLSVDEEEMGLMFRVRLSAFFAGATAASLAGFYLLYKDYKLAQDAVSHQVRDAYESLEKCYEALDKRVTALEQKGVETSIPVETSEPQ